MALTDNLAIRIKAESGQTAITDSIQSLVIDTGTGTVTNVDDATYGRLWRLTGGGKSGAPVGLGEWGSPGNETTIAIRFRITNRANNYTRFAMFGTSVDIGIIIGNAGVASGGIRAGTISNGSMVGQANLPSYTAGTVRTIVFRFVEGATDNYASWFDTTGRSGTDPDVVSTGSFLYSTRYRAYIGFLTAAETLDILDYAVWTRSLTNAEAAAVADDIRGQLYSSGSTDATADGVTLTGAATLTPGTATDGSGAVNATAEGVTLTGTATLTPGTATGGASGSFVSSPMYSSGILQASVALDWTWYPGAIGAAPTAALVHGSGATAGDGTLTMPGLPAGAGFYLAEGLDLNGEVLVALEYGTVT